MFKHKIRCFHFDYDGRPINGGCRRAVTCSFVHPSEDAWETATLPRHPTNRNKYRDRDSARQDSWNDERSPVASSGRRSYRDDRDFERDDSRRQSFEGRRLSRSSSRASRESRSPSGEPRTPRKDSFAASTGAEWKSRRMSFDNAVTDNHTNPNIAAQPQPPSASAMNTTTTTNAQSSVSLESASLTTVGLTGPLPTPPTTATGATEIFANMSISRPTGAFSSLTIPPTQPRTNYSSKTTTNIPPPPDSAPPPPPPEAPAPMQPPYPLPEFPKSLKLETEKSSAPEPSAEEKVAMWEQRIKIFSDCAQARERIAVLDEEYEIALKVTESRIYASLNEDAKARLNTQLAALASRCDEARQSYKQSQELLLKAASWPVAPQQTAPEDREKYGEIVKFVSELNTTVEQMKEMLGDIRTYKPPPALFLPGDSSDEEEEEGGAGVAGSAMDVDQPIGSTTSGKIPLPTRKRRRVSELLDGPTMGRAQERKDATPTQSELEEYLEKLARYEHTLSTLRNDFVQSESERQHNFKYLLESKIEEIQHSHAQERSARDRKREADEAATQAKIAEMQQKISSTGSEIGELATEIGDMLLNVDRLEQEVVAERQSRQESFERVLQIEQRLQAYTAAQQSSSNTLDTLKTALKAYTTRPPSPPLSPKLPSPSYLLQSLEEPLIDALRTSIRPLVEEVRGDVEAVVENKNRELYTTVWPKIEYTLKILDTIQRRIEAGVGDAGVAQALGTANPV
ncbi:hypothetical protein BDZ97DRAFT_1040158 [Flammula alnicola]|nr:hypothetical protein BDZ97DRAFT_1040158 [Flammula alnicola]